LFYNFNIVSIICVKKCGVNIKYLKNTFHLRFAY